MLWRIELATGMVLKDLSKGLQSVDGRLNVIE